jgi:DNA-binding NarL/FixJ family response regulator
MKRLAIIADHTCMVDALRLVLRQTAGFQLVGVLDGRTNVRRAVRERRPDIVLVDDMQEREHAPARLKELREELPEVKSVLLTLELNPARLREAFDAGADAVISKAVHPVSPATLIRETANGSVFHSPGSYVAPVRANADGALTSRELEILQMVAEGQTNGGIAKELWVTEQTVKFHLSNVYRKLGVKNRTAASRYAHLHALVDPRVRAVA